jgi:hypothetical protein
VMHRQTMLPLDWPLTVAPSILFQSSSVSAYFEVIGSSVSANWIGLSVLVLVVGFDGD